MLERSMLGSNMTRVREGCLGKVLWGGGGTKGEKPCHQIYSIYRDGVGGMLRTGF